MTRRPTTYPTSAPPTEEATKLHAASPALRLAVPATAAVTANRYRMRDDASFSRLSPSSTVTRWRGRRMVLSTDVAATALGGATIAPNATAAAQGRPGTSSLIVMAMAAAVNNTAPSASNRIGRSACRNAAQSVR